VILWWFNGDLMGFTLWLFNIAIEHGPVEIVDFPINSMGGSFHRLFVCLPEGI
jgi:hypothetical protein